MTNWRRNQAAVTVATFVGFTGFTLVMPFLPLYFQELGEHDAARIAVWSGLSLGVTPAITAMMAPVWARVADRYGRKLMVTRSLAAFIFVMAAMAGARQPWHVFALRTVLGFFAGYGAIAMTMAAESAPAEHMATAIGWVQTAQRLGPALGPVIGGVLAQMVGLRRSFLIAAVVYLVACLLVYFGYRERDEAHHGAGRESSRSSLTFADIRRVPHFVLFMVGVFGLQLVDRSFGPILPLYLSAIGMSDARVPFMSGVIFTIAAGAAAVGNQLTAALLRRVRVSTVLWCACSTAALATSAFVVGPRVEVLIAAAVVMGAGMGIATTTVYTAASQAVDEASRGVAFGYLTTAYLSGLAVSPMLAGFVGAVSMRAVFVLDALGLAVLALALRRTANARGVPPAMAAEA